MKVKCKYCEREFVVSPSDVEDINNYHCRDCNQIHIKKQRKKGKKIKYDWSTIKKLNQVAMKQGHKSIWSKEKPEVKSIATTN